jgi:uncharacterized protein YbjT (DUF2867 family)
VILVVGGTGDLGGRVVRRLVDAGEEVRCLVRSGSVTSGLPDAVEVVRGDLTRVETLGPVCAGVDTAVCGATAIGRLLAGRGGPSIDAVDRQGTLALVDAAEQAGVRRFVYVSYASPGDSQGSPIERAKIAVEERLGRTSMRAVVVRPDAFHEVHLAAVGRFDVAGRKVSVIGHGDNPRRWVATEDAAALTAALATEPDPPAVVEFGGPEALSRNELVRLAEQTGGFRVRRQAMPRAAARLLMRATARVKPEVSSVLGLSLMMDLGQVRWDDAPLRERGIDPQPASAFVRDHTLRSLT